jgi:excisionase family DNA binding protein
MHEGLEHDLLTVSEAALLLRLKPSTIRAWTCQRRIPFVKVGRLVRIRRCDVEALVRASLVPSRGSLEPGKTTFGLEEWDEFRG